MVDERRIKKHIVQEHFTGKSILYWMNRDGRIQDNWSLLYAQELSLMHDVPLIIIYNLDPTFLGGRRRQFDFKIAGLQEVEQYASEYNIPFIIVTGKETEKDVQKFAEHIEAGAIVTDFCPLRLPQQWLKHIVDWAEGVDVSVYEVDAHNIVPVWSASDKLEFAAHTIRPKINRQLKDFLTDIPDITQQSNSMKEKALKLLSGWNLHVWDQIEQSATVSLEEKTLSWIVSGYEAGMNRVKEFITSMGEYSEKRNDPNENALSHLSPYFHYGHISPQRVAYMVERADVDAQSKSVFLEEMIVRRELADNYCYYEKEYDNPRGFHAWSQKTHNEHKNDERDYLYTQDTFEHAMTHDELWNACQEEMLQTGKMHGYMRMYWAKKILEWTPDVATAQKIAIYLNDTYELDGRDPSGYVGIAWSLGGVHDRAWGERPIFGKIRYMNAAGCKRKFDTQAYIQKWCGNREVDEQQILL